ncbi:3-hydroxyacyl-CoA dehydrogenase NAD-binding domain-containing protein, partial [Brachybacterium sp. AOP42-B2-9]|uniref:3-hydroxyacyl-CoA dehydrogenase NAD-binding domain-containing protein n=1 Tax=Brachybacterium sp. AOP42-B2-9 TaxID=3457672 RepID=UPI0040337AD1
MAMASTFAAAPLTDEGVPQKTISTVTIVGAGYMGGGIAQVLAMAGFDVTIADVDVEVANKSLE